MEKLERALHQRIYLLSVNQESNDLWNFSVKGESKNIYKQKYEIPIDLNSYYNYELKV